MAKKSCPFLYGELLYRSGQDFLDIRQFGSFSMGSDSCHLLLFSFFGQCGQATTVIFDLTIGPRSLIPFLKRAPIKMDQISLTYSMLLI